MPTTAAVLKPDAAQMLTRAVLRTATHLNLPDELLGEALGVSADTVRWLWSGDYLLVPNTAEWDVANRFVSAFHLLDRCCKSEEEARNWLYCEVPGLHAKPIDLLRTADGLMKLARFLDATGGQR